MSSPQLALPLRDGWRPVTVARLGRRSPLSEVRVQVGQRLVTLAVRTSARGGQVRLRCEGDAPGPTELALDVALAPIFLHGTTSAAVVPLHWGLGRRGHLSDPGEFFGHALRWGVEKLAWRAPRGWGRPIQAALGEVLREAAAALCALLAPPLRAATLRFPARRRAALYAQLLRDDRGWLRQALASAPGAVLYAHALSRLPETEEAGVRLALDLKDGRRLDAALTDANRAWRAAFVAWAREGSRFHDGARRAFATAAAAPPAADEPLDRAQRLLVRRAGPHVDPALLLLPPPVRLVPEDLPADPRANAAWFEVMKVPGVTVAASGIGPPEGHQRAFAAFASRHAAALHAPPPGLGRDAWLGELSRLLLDQGRAPSRATDPAALLAAVDVAALRRRPAPFAGRFVHPLDGGAHGPVLVGPGELSDGTRLADPALCRRTFDDWAQEQVKVHQLTTLRELRAEGARQHNCVATYDEQIELGGTVVLSVEVAGRPLTLALVRREGRFRVSEYKGFANRKASRAEWAALEPWLRHAGVAR